MTNNKRGVLDKPTRRREMKTGLICKLKRTHTISFPATKRIYTPLLEQEAISLTPNANKRSYKTKGNAV